MTENQNPEGITRRAVVHSAAWSVPVIAAAIATPLAAASGPTETEPPRTPAKCIRIKPNHGHGGNPGNKEWWQGVYSDGSTTEPMSNGQAMSDPVWGPLCRAEKGRS